MNLFVLDLMPEQAAKYHNDSHVRSGIIESILMMGYAYDDKAFKPWAWLKSDGRYVNHPMSIWVRDSRQNFDWTLQYSQALINEFHYRFSKTHKCESIMKWITMNLPLKNLYDGERTDWPRCFGTWKDKIVYRDDIVREYRDYYCLAKKHLAKWTKREEPFWWRNYV